MAVGEDMRKKSVLGRIRKTGICPQKHTFIKRYPYNPDNEKFGEVVMDTTLDFTRNFEDAEVLKLVI